MPISKEDRQLIDQIIKRNEKTLFYFYNRYQLIIFRFINKQINDKAVAEEITQDVFLDFIEEVRDFRGTSSIKTFILTIARNKTIDYIRKKKIKKILFSAIPSFIIEKASSIFLDETLEKKELAAKIKSVFSKLPNDYQIILRLKYIDGERVKGIAQKMSLTFKATESLLFRARQAFIQVFKNENV